MSENENLRALLAEARGWVGGWSGILPVSAAAIDSLRQRIDAALAEPVARLNPYSAAVAEMRGDAWQKQAMQRERERDEARAEVERLKAHSEVRDRLTASEIRGLLAKLSDALHEGNKTRAEVAAAYQRGAEAMREAAAQEIERQVDAMMLRAGLAADIRDLPVPEDKP